ncbi:DUF1003 domain-containing protein [Chamaesiphon sp. GL140_3_metabinner_50]|uniref:DUF1003 domain-containing protein n=1 Tax=Chamaesiphon sp. GL140_3_metabinner_50 TaxID=2970812 RepID=UPI0025FCAF44|nr:DUF1003 domain-containing protein [Chamaesiphon sp. GL140_3_metabinner_50]
MDTSPIVTSPQLTPTDLERLSYLRSIQPARSTTLRSPSRGDRIADLVTQIVGSWRFIIIQSCLLTVWIVLNVVAWIGHWDPYPFILLNLALSFQAAYATPFILMSQNRQSTLDRDNAQQDLDCDIKAELEIELIHEKLDLLKEREIADLHEKLDSLKDREIANLHLLVRSQAETIARIEELLLRQITTDRR